MLSGVMLHDRLLDDRVSLSAASVSGSDLISSAGFMGVDELSSARNVRQEIDLKLDAIRSRAANLDLHARYAQGRVPGEGTQLGGLKNSLQSRYTTGMSFRTVSRWTEISQSDLEAKLSLFSNRLRLSSTYSSSAVGSEKQIGFGEYDPYAFSASPDEHRSRHDHRINAALWRGDLVDLSAYGSFGGYTTLATPSDESFETLDGGGSSSATQTWMIGGKASLGPFQLNLSHRSAAYEYESRRYFGFDTYTLDDTRRNHFQRLRTGGTLPGTEGKVELDLASILESESRTAALGGLLPTATWFQLSRRQKIPDGRRVASVKDGAGFGLDWVGDFSNASVGIWRDVDDNLELGEETADTEDWSADFNYDFFDDFWGVSLFLYASHNAYKEIDAGTLQTDIGGGVSLSLYHDDLPDVEVGMDFDYYISDEYDYEYRGVSETVGSFISFDFSKYLPIEGRNYKPLLKFAYKAEATRYSDSEIAQRPELNHAIGAWSGMRW
jgi:hypothetical protein